jgi:ribosomal protein L11 methyltransferase
MDYIELTISIDPKEPYAEILIAQLADYGFDGFVDTETGIQAYCNSANSLFEKAIQNTLISEISSNFKLNYTKKIIKHQNWNALWESDFQPVNVDDKLHIIAPFHSRENLKGLMIEIQPQMSFGTGHHQTTYMMAKAILNLNDIPEKILDMGSGTGVLAILCEKLGANNLLAIDIEEWAVENAIENCERNQCSHIEVLLGDIDLIENKKFDMILANINKNVLKFQLPSYSKSLEKGGVLLLSGFFESDNDEIIKEATNQNFKLIQSYEKESWAALKFEKK